MDINTGINPQSFGFDRSFFEACCKMGDEDRLRFCDSLCEVAFNRRMRDLQRLRIKVLKSVTCNECDHCRACAAIAGSGTVPVGFCMRNESPLTAQDLRTSQWDMCGDELIDE